MSALLPVGFPLGFQKTQKQADPGLIIRQGNRAVAVDAENFDLWWSARRMARVGDLREWAKRERLEDYEDRMEALKAEGLLVEYEGSVAALFSELTIVPTAIGAGFDLPASTSCSLLSHDMSFVASIDHVSYLVWAQGGMGKDIRTCCESAAKVLGLGLQDVLHVCSVSLLQLLEVSALSFDTKAT